MFLLRLLLKNAFRHRLRTLLTMVGLVVAISAFGLLRTIVDAWYAGVDATSSTRLITRSAISLTFPLPLNYAERIRAVEGVSGISWANWFGGIYITERNFFAQFAVDAPSYLALYPEFKLDDAEKQAFFRDRQGAVVGRKLAAKFGWKLGDTVALRGTIYPGTSGVAAHRCAVRQLAGRDADRDREGLPAQLRVDERGHLAGGAGGELHHHPDHHGGDGQHDDDDRARAAGRVRHAQGAGFSARLRGQAAVRREPADRLDRRRAGHRADLPDGRSLREGSGHAVPDLPGVGIDGGAAGAGRAGGRRRVGCLAGLEDVPHRHRSGIAPRGVMCQPAQGCAPRCLEDYPQLSGS